MALKPLPSDAITGLNRALHRWLMRLEEHLSSGEGGASPDGNFLVVDEAGTLANARVFTIGHGLDATDAGPGSTYTVNVDETELDHGLLGGLTDDDHTQYFKLLGRAGGQIAYGGTGPGEDLTLRATPHATPGTIFLNDQVSSTVTKSDPSGVWTGQLFWTQLTATDNYASQGRGLQFESDLYPATTKTISAHRALEGTGYNYGAGTVTTLQGLTFAGGCMSTGNITTLNIASLQTYGTGGGAIGTVNGINIYNLASFNTPTNIYGININASTTVVGTLKYGLYIGNQAGATSNYSIYTAGGACFLSAGAATVVPLTLKGASAQSANLFDIAPNAGANLLEVDASGNLGLNVDPEEILHIKKTGTNVVARFDTYNDTLVSASTVLGRRARGTYALPTKVTADANLLRLMGTGYYETAAPGWALNKAGIILAAVEDFTDAANGTYIAFETTPIGDTTRAEACRVSSQKNLLFNVNTDPTNLVRGIAVKGSTAPTAVGADTAALYTKDANSVAGDSWWHAMGERDAEHVMVGAFLNADTGDPTVSHESALSINYGDDCVGIVKNGAWSRFLMTNVVSYDDNLIFYDDEVVWN